MNTDYLIGVNIILLTKSFLIECFFLFIRLIGVKNISIRIDTQNDPSIDILKKTFYTRIDEECIPYGIIIGNLYIGYGTRSEDGRIKKYEYIIYYFNENAKLINSRKNGFRYIGKNCEQIYKCKKDILLPTKTQEKIINKIHEIYEKRDHATIFIYGETGIGKSKIADIIAQKLNSYLTQHHLLDNNYYNRNCDFNILYGRFLVCKNKPLVIVCDEVETILSNDRIELEEEKLFKKRDWNIFFDNIDSGYFPYTIFILTTNKDKKYFDDLDISLLRKGRIDLVCHMTKENVEWKI